MCSAERCCSSCILGLVLLANVPFAYLLNITSLNGEMTFDLKGTPGADVAGAGAGAGLNTIVGRAEADGDTDGGAGNGTGTDGGEKIVLRVVRKNVTVAPLVECQYQYPEKEQIDTILSNMMNELTKVFVKAQHLVLNEDELTVARRAQNTRFKIVAKKTTNFFEKIYKNMTVEYLELYNATREHVSRAGRDPCANQPLIRQMWRDILDNSLALLRSAARATIKEHKRVHNRTEPSTTRIDLFLARQIARVKADQLDLICYKFQLCFNDLL